MFNLVAAKGGPKLTPTQTEGPPQFSFNNTRVTCKRITMKQFADMVLSSRMGRPVADKTGVSGAYDVQMAFAPDPFDPGGAPAGSDLGGPSFSTALQEQLGLRLETSKGPTAFLVVDKVVTTLPGSKSIRRCPARDSCGRNARGWRGRS